MTTRPENTPATDPDSPIEEDVVVVGGGAAGLTAAVFLARYGLETLVFARGKSAIHQCAHLENYLGFPGGISPERFLDLGRAHAEGEGARVVEDLVEAVDGTDGGFRVETGDGRSVRTRYVLAASAYDADYLDAFEDALETDDDPGFLFTEGGRTPVEGIYATGWMTSDTVHQAVVNAGDGARVALALIRDEMSERYWPAVGERYVDWVVDDGRYGGEGWDEHAEEWFDREMLPEEHGLDPALVERARDDLKAEFLGRCIDEEERERRERAGQRRLLEQLDDDVIREYVATELGDGTDTDTDSDTETGTDTDTLETTDVE